MAAPATAAVKSSCSDSRVEPPAPRPLVDQKTGLGDAQLSQIQPGLHIGQHAPDLIVSQDRLFGLTPFPGIFSGGLVAAIQQTQGQCGQGEPGIGRPDGHRR